MARRRAPLLASAAEGDCVRGLLAGLRPPAARSRGEGRCRPLVVVVVADAHARRRARSVGGGQRRQQRWRQRQRWRGQGRRRRRRRRRRRADRAGALEPRRRGRAVLARRRPRGARDHVVARLPDAPPPGRAAPLSHGPGRRRLHRARRGGPVRLRIHGRKLEGGGGGRGGGGGPPQKGGKGGGGGGGGGARCPQRRSRQTPRPTTHDPSRTKTHAPTHNNNNTQP